MTSSIYLVEDNDDIAHAVVLRLQLRGYQVERTDRGGGAVDRICEMKPDVVLLDITLPDTDGVTIAQRLSEVLGDDRPPIVFLTASMRDDILAGIDAVANSELLPKPFASSDLLDSIDRALGPKTPSFALVSTPAATKRHTTRQCTHRTDGIETN